MNELDNRYFNHGNMKEINISSEMRDDFLSYSMSVIIDRALPDVRDGMKPVHRRVLWAMYDAGFTPDKPHVKSANIVGEVMGKYHPHGDTAIYDTMVRMAQNFSYRYPLVDGHGNFGSLDGDGAAAMRYTEARMSKISLELLQDIKKETIDWRDNYDARHKEPSVLPSKFPNLLVNGSMGIAVGMATNMPTHNLGEVIDGIIATIDNPDITTAELMQLIPGPDFPTGGYIIGRSGIRQAYESGRGSIIMRAKVDISDMGKGKSMLTVKEIPYLTNKQVLYDKINDLVKDRIVEGIVDMRDLSNSRNGIRIEIELKKDVQPEVILNQLYKLSPLQSSFGVNNNVLVNNTPMLLSLKDIIRHYIDHQIEIITRRTEYDLAKSKERAHILEGLKTAIDNIDRIMNIVRSSKDDDEVYIKFNLEFGLDNAQSKAILDMQFRRLTGLQREKINNELDELHALILDYEDILANHSRVLAIIKSELLLIKEKFNDPRRTEIVDGGVDVEDEDLIPEDNVVISLSMKGYVKRLPVSTYRTQNRGGRGVKGMSLTDDDIVDQNISMSTHDHLLLFTNKGKVYRIKGYQIPESSRNAKGMPVQNIINIEKDEKVKALVPISREHGHKYLFFITRRGLCKRVEIEEFDSIRQTGKIALKLKEDDEILMVLPTSGNDEIIIGASSGKAVRINENSIRDMGRTAAGVRGMNIDAEDEIIGAATSTQGSEILVISKLGFGKKTPVDEYRITSRGAKGVKTINITDKNGPLVALKAVNGDEDCMIMTNDGIIIRIDLSKVSTLGRATTGVRLIKPQDGTFVKAVNIVEHEEEIEEKPLKSDE